MDDVAKVMIDAAALFGGAKFDGLFNAASFSKALALHSGTKKLVDGHVVRSILRGRSDVIVLGRAHLRIRWWRRWFNSTGCSGCGQHVAVKYGTRRWGIYCARCQETREL